MARSENELMLTTDSDGGKVMGDMPAIERHGENVVFSITK